MIICICHKVDDSATIEELKKMLKDKQIADKCKTCLTDIIRRCSEEN